MSIEFATVEEALEEFRQGRQIVLVDDEDRENEGDLALPAEKVTPAAINFMAKHGRGLICLTLTEERCDELNLPLMSPVNTSALGTAFTESIDARRGTTTGISAADRATTILAAIDPGTRAADLGRPGHVFPLRARRNGLPASPCGPRGDWQAPLPFPELKFADAPEKTKGFLRAVQGACSSIPLQ